MLHMVTIWKNDPRDVICSKIIVGRKAVKSMLQSDKPWSPDGRKKMESIKITT